MTDEAANLIQEQLCAIHATLERQLALMEWRDRRDFFLNDDELVTLTGYARRAPQCQWLTQNGYTFSINGKGRPTVLRAHVETIMDIMKRTEPELEPDWSAI